MSRLHKIRRAVRRHVIKCKIIRFLSFSRAQRVRGKMVATETKVDTLRQRKGNKDATDTITISEEGKQKDLKLDTHERLVLPNCNFTD